MRFFFQNLDPGDPYISGTPVFNSTFCDPTLGVLTYPKLIWCKVLYGRGSNQGLKQPTSIQERHAMPRDHGPIRRCPTHGWPPPQPICPCRVTSCAPGHGKSRTLLLRGAMVTSHQQPEWQKLGRLAPISTD